jgi:release factor glutamine methyltransferase
MVFPGVFHPGLFLSTTLLLDALDQVPLKKDSSVLDLGTGTGICAIFLAMKGAQATATDISPLAVRCARANVAINFMEDRVRVLEGDLFLPVEGETFDLVVFNAPYYEGNPRDWSEYAWRGERVLNRFAQGLAEHLHERGRALLTASTELDLSMVRQDLRENGFEVHEICRRRIPGETMFVYECVRPHLGDLSEMNDLKNAYNENGRESKTYCYG